MTILEKYENKDYRNEIEIKIYEGETLIAKKNKFLGKLIINIPFIMIKEEIKLDIIFIIDIKSVFKIFAKDNCKGEKNNLDIYLNSIYINENEIEKIINRGKEIEEEDKSLKKNKLINRNKIWNINNKNNLNLFGDDFKKYLNEKK